MARVAPALVDVVADREQVTRLVVEEAVVHARELAAAQARGRPRARRARSARSRARQRPAPPRARAGSADRAGLRGIAERARREELELLAQHPALPAERLAPEGGIACRRRNRRRGGRRPARRWPPPMRSSQCRAAAIERRPGVARAFHAPRAGARGRRGSTSPTASRSAPSVSLEAFEPLRGRRSGPRPARAAPRAGSCRCPARLPLSTAETYSGASGSQRLRVVPVVEMPLVALHRAHRVQRVRRAHEELAGRNVAEVVGGEVRQQREAHVGGRGPVRDGRRPDAPGSCPAAANGPAVRRRSRRTPRSGAPAARRKSNLVRRRAVRRAGERPADPPGDAAARANHSSRIGAAAGHAARADDAIRKAAAAASHGANAIDRSAAARLAAVARTLAARTVGSPAPDGFHCSSRRCETSIRQAVRAIASSVDRRLVGRNASGHERLRDMPAGDRAAMATRCWRTVTSPGLRSRSSEEGARRRAARGSRSRPRSRATAAQGPSSPAAAARSAPAARGCGAGCRRASSGDSADNGLRTRRAPAPGTRGSSQPASCQSPRIQRWRRSTSAR